MTENPTVKEIVKGYLAANRFDGLYNESLCSCDIDDLDPCDSMSSECEPGYKHLCSKCSDIRKDECEDYECTWCISSIKQEATET